MTKHVYLGLGSNMGDRECHLLTAIKLLQEHDEIQVVKKSSIIETAPMGDEDQDDFLNAVIEIETTLSPNQLLAVCLEIELQEGRVRLKRWGPRTLDIDILFFGSAIIDEDGLQIPHPELHMRAFVLIPLVQIAPAFIHPKYGHSVKAMQNTL